MFLVYDCKWYLELKNGALLPKNVTKFINFFSESMLYLLV